MSSVDPLTFMFAGCRFETRGKSNAAKADYRAEEDLHFNARDTLEDIRKAWPLDETSWFPLVGRFGLKTWQDWMMCILPHVAKAYGLHRNDVLEKWVNHYGISLCFEQMVGGADDA